VLECRSEFALSAAISARIGGPESRRVCLLAGCFPPGRVRVKRVKRVFMYGPRKLSTIRIRTDDSFLGPYINTRLTRLTRISAPIRDNPARACALPGHAFETP
jgi:hypothetical protein